ncbi:hypothetical protein DY000_02055498 [Brassica cretica]|uniref:Secreted protein n=1 Tax=Brassica cretica TaxID=69181 RepID=A0ABQ7ACB5_BRACR|nr:hypothetical protein DY000_02055498 [Brassica cretica]
MDLYVLKLFVLLLKQLSQVIHTPSVQFQGTPPISRVTEEVRIIYALMLHLFSGVHVAIHVINSDAVEPTHVSHYKTQRIIKRATTPDSERRPEALGRVYNTMTFVPVHRGMDRVGGENLEVGTAQRIRICR